MYIKILLSTSSSTISLVAKPKRPKKLIHLDIGFVNLNSDLYLEYISEKTDNLYTGRLGEQITGQLLLALDSRIPINLYYWAKDKVRGSAEIDYTFTYKGHIVGIEVKAGTYGTLKTLFSFADSVNNSLLVRVYSRELKYESLTYDSKRYSVLSVPFYLIHRLLNLLDNMIEQSSTKSNLP